MGKENNMKVNQIIQGDSLEVLKTLPDEFVDCVVTSPPYWGLRDYGVVGQLGLEKTPEEYVSKMVEVFKEVKRVLKKEGTLWLNLGDSYNSSPHWDSKDYGIGKTTHKGRTGTKELKPKDLVGIPWRVAFALQADGWYLRQDIIWHKPNPMPESVTDRCTKSHEYIFLMSKSPKYYFNNEAIKENSVDEESYKGRRFRNAKAIVAANVRPFSNPNTLDKGNKADGKTYEKRNKRSVWVVNVDSKRFFDKESHFATFPPNLITPMVKAGCPPKGLVLDCFMGSGTTALVARSLGRNYVGIELSIDYIKIAQRRLAQEILL